MFVWFGVIFSFVFSHGGQPASSNVPPARMILGVGAVGLMAMAIAIANVFLAIFYGIKAGNGKWAEYPVIGRLARRIVGV
jgi:uncharacterized membrane protein